MIRPAQVIVDLETWNQEWTSALGVIRLALTDKLSDLGKDIIIHRLSRLQGRLDGTYNGPLSSNRWDYPDQ